MSILTSKHQKLQKVLLRLSFLVFIKIMLFNIMLKTFRLVEVLTSCLNFSKVRDQHKIRLFVQHWFFDEEHLIFGMMNECELHQFLKEYISSKQDNSQWKTCMYCLENIMILFHELEANLPFRNLSTLCQICHSVLSKILCFYFWQLVNAFSIFYLCLGTKHYMHSQRKVGSMHCIIIQVKEI